MQYEDMDGMGLIRERGLRRLNQPVCQAVLLTIYNGGDADRILWCAMDFESLKLLGLYPDPKFQHFDGKRFLGLLSVLKLGLWPK